MLIYLYDESGSPIGMMFRMDEYSKNQYDYYFFEKNAFGDIIAVYNSNGTKIGTYTYDAWGNICSTTCTASTNSLGWMIVNRFNPFRYRGYFYDVETSLYYLQSRYYNPELGRFISADCYVATGQGLLGNNMYIYCNNNPVMGTDPTGEWPNWKKIGNAISNGWSKVKRLAQNTFGAAADVVNTIRDSKIIQTPLLSPIMLDIGERTIKNVQYGDSSKFISAYAIGDSSNWLMSSAGIKINIFDFTLDVSLGLNNTGISGSIKNGKSSNKFGLKLDLSTLSLGIEHVSSVNTFGNQYEEAYTNVGVSASFIIIVAGFLQTGQVPQGAYA